MSTLFNNDNANAGYRLHYMEIYNWGTFHGKIFKLEMNGKTSLLTGANGSGKTTIIDALLTLLVPRIKRFYNQSSGAEIKKDRDESSYFWGHWGKTYSELDEKSKIEQLRNKIDNPYSVLLACFKNAGTLHTITLVQVRWYYNGTINTKFIVCPNQLNIKEHFSTGHFDYKGAWVRQLVKSFPKTEVFGTFKEYANKFSSYFGLKEKALSLFNQTVGIKVLGDLTQFIRSHMLEEPSSEDNFKSLYDQYNDLLISHRAIQKDEKQLNLLTPVIDSKYKLEEIDQKVSNLNLVQNQISYYLDKIEYGFLENHINEIERESQSLKNNKGHFENELIKLDTEKSQLITQKASLNIDSQIQLLNKDIEAETKDRNSKKSLSDDYLKIAEKFELSIQLSEEVFKQNSSKIKQIESSISARLEDSSNKKYKYIDTRENKLKEINDTQIKIDSLLKRKNRIPEELITVRKRLLGLLDTSEEELPFVGELIKVKQDQLHWEAAIEKVLHGFSLNLLVPEKYHKRVNQFVHENNLNAKLVYQRIDSKIGDAILRGVLDEESLINKIEIKSSNLYKKWLEKYLNERFDYFCTDDLDVFYGCIKALTSSRLIRNKARHEKDDRISNFGKLNFTLGWDNRETVQLLQHFKTDLEKEVIELNQKIQLINPELANLQQQQTLIYQLNNIQSFYQINWQQHALKIDSINKQIDILKKSSNQYKAIASELERVETEIIAHQKSKEKLDKEIGSLENEYNRLNSRKLKIDFELLTDEGLRSIEKYIVEEGIREYDMNDISEFDNFKYKLQGNIKAKLNATEKEQNELKLSSVKLIGKFVNPEQKILQEFPDWSGDVLNLSTDLESLNELEDLFKSIKNQRLVENKRRFKQYMDFSMLDALTNYWQTLKNDEARIKDIIEELNIPLKKITFNSNPDTYLQLECRSTKDPEIKIFKEQMVTAIPNGMEYATSTDEAYKESVFNNIKILIEELNKDELRRKKVTDSRNWLTFSAREYARVDDTIGQYHDNTASYSGGQKAQFTYAILGAAIAHQFGIFTEGSQHKSLRFITVDEAFSKLDPEKSQFLMKFCEQLNLQILVVTPLDKINIAEPYISAVHFVEIKNKNNSNVYNLTIEEYTEKKELFKHSAQLES